MNLFELAFRKKLESDGFVPVHRGDDTLWRKPDERGILYDTAEAVMQVIKK